LKIESFGGLLGSLNALEKAGRFHQASHALFAHAYTFGLQRGVHSRRTVGAA
jgi:hypothetical protein